MKTVEGVLRSLSRLYDFNAKLRSFRVPESKEPGGKATAPAEPDRKTAPIRRQ